MTCERFGAEGITVHPRPDERHIRYKDVYDLKPVLNTEFNIEGNPVPRFVELVKEIKPAQVTLVPDAENVLTSNAGWDTVKHQTFLREMVAEFKSCGIRVSIFIDPVPQMIEMAAQTGTDRVELYTEAYARGYAADPSKAVAPYTVAALFAACCQTEPQPNAADPAATVMANILSRKSVRSYTSDTIPSAVMEHLLRAAMAAPSGRNIQPWSFVVLKDTSRYDEIFGDNFNLSMYKQSAAVVVLCADTTVVRPPRENPDAPAVQQPNNIWRDDMGAVTENLLLAVEAYGLGACWTASTMVA